MKRGDLVKMKRICWWTLQSRKDYEHNVAIVLEQHANAVKVILSDGKIKCSLAEDWEVISECRR